MPRPWAKSKTSYARAIAEGYRSGLEKLVASQLSGLGVPFRYEPKDGKIRYIQPEKKRIYTPDFELPNGIIVETKGRFVASDRMKHLMIKEQHPEKDIRFVFSNPQATINKTSKTTYAAWCEQYGFLWAARTIPLDWIKEPKK